MGSRLTAYAIDAAGLWKWPSVVLREIGQKNAVYCTCITDPRRPQRPGLTGLRGRSMDRPSELKNSFFGPNTCVHRSLLDHELNGTQTPSCMRVLSLAC